MNLQNMIPAPVHSLAQALDPKKIKKYYGERNAKIYIVGGWVRNTVLGIKPSDIDLAGPFSSDQLTQILEPVAKVVVVNEKLGTAHILIEGSILEYTPFRTEKYRGGEHTPYLAERVTDMEPDAKRRDFTCNALYCDIQTGEIIDLFGGLDDIKNRRLKAANDPQIVFGADGLRLMRLVRMMAELEFLIDKDTFEAAKANSHLIKDISAERVRDELEKILNADQTYGVKDAHYHGLVVMGFLGLTKHILPELEACKGVSQPAAYHKFDVYEHTLQAVRHADPEVRLAALMHDLGKPVSLQKDGNMHKHAQESAQIAALRLGQDGLKFPKKTINNVVRLVELHMFDLHQNTRPEKLRRFVAQNSDIIHQLCKLIRADGLASGLTQTREGRLLQTYNELISEGVPMSVSQLDIDGFDLIDLKLQPQKIKETLENLLDLCINEGLKNQRSALRDAAKKLASKKSKDT